MKYEVSIDIEAPIDRVIELFNDPVHLPRWMPELVNSELIEGTLGQPGAVGKLTMKDGQKEYLVIETVTEKNLPSIFARTYKMDNIFLTIRDSFIASNPGTTRYISKTSGDVAGPLKYISFLVGMKLKTQAKKRLISFKRFVENTFSAS